MINGKNTINSIAHLHHVYNSKKNSYIYSFFTMVASMRITVAVLSILCFISTAYGEYGVKDLVTVRSGRQIQGKPEWNVQIVNKCNCSQSNIFLSCQGFQTVEPVDPAIFSKHGDQCSVNKGLPIASKKEVTFSYAWDPPFFLFPLSTRSLC